MLTRTPQLIATFVLSYACSGDYKSMIDLLLNYPETAMNDADGPRPIPGAERVGGYSEKEIAEFIDANCAEIEMLEKKLFSIIVSHIATDDIVKEIAA